MPDNAELETHDIQGLVASGYGHLKNALYVLLQIVDASKARTWLGAQIPEITTAKDKPKGDFHLNIALTSGGLVRLGVEDGTMSHFSRAFRQGMVTDHRSRVLGDDAYSLRQWRWGTGATCEPDVLILIFANGQANAEHRLNQVIGNDSGLELLTVLTAELQPDGKEHFGFVDGISQPTIAGFEHQYLGQLKRTGQAVSLQPGEFLLGYTNEFGTITEKKNILGRNGTYLVFRQMEQHVAEFHEYFRRLSGGDDEKRRRLEAKVVGRWPGGAPLTLSPLKDSASLRLADDFQYAQDDPHGYLCPIGAHIRRANPRDSLEANRDRATVRTRRRRLLRRGRPYGAGNGQDALGLHFLCLCGDLERQFEFVQQSWINNAAFADLAGETDPLTGTRPGPKGGRFSIQRAPVRERLEGLPQFTTVRGGGYFFLPGIRALEKLAGK